MINKNDPRLTAFALNELSPQEHAEVESAIESSSELQDEIKSIRETVSLLNEGFATEALPPASRDKQPIPTDQRLRRPIRRWLTIAATVAAAIMVLAFCYISFEVSRNSVSHKSRPTANPLESSEAGKDDALDSEETLQSLVERFNDCIDNEQFEESEMIARQARELAPESDVVLAMQWKSRFMRRYRDQDSHSSRKDGFVESMADVDRATVAGVNLGAAYPDAELWEQIVQQRGKFTELNLNELSDEFAPISEARQRVGDSPGYIDPQEGIIHFPVGDLVVPIVNDTDTDELSSDVRVEILPNGTVIVAGPPEDAEEVTKMITRLQQAAKEADGEMGAIGPLGEGELFIDGDGVSRGENSKQSDSLPATIEPVDSADSASGEEKPAKISEPKPAPKPKSWKRVKAIPNTSRLMVGDKDELAMQGMQVRVKVDGFRARVMLDCMYFNDREQQLEGSFKLRLPNDASLFYFAFGESAYQYKPDLEPKEIQLELIRNEFRQQQKNKTDDADENEYVSLSLADIREEREEAWQNVKEARVVPREKAAFAYGQTVRRKVDPALVEWAGAGVFNAKVFPLAAKKMHRIVIGYDVDLQLVDGKLVYRLGLPEEGGATQVDVDFALLKKHGEDKVENTEFVSAKTNVDPIVENGRLHYRFDMPTETELEFSFDAPENVVLRTRDDAADQFFATQVAPELPSEEVNGSSHAVFLVDTSLSSNPDKFNAWLAMLRATLESNRDAMKQFAVLFFDVDSHWWQEKFVENSEANVEQLIAYCETLSLEGATDLHAAFHRIARAEWIDDSASPDLFLLSDAAATWGETNLARINRQPDKSNVASLFAYQTGLTGTDSRALHLLARKHGGAVFNITTEAEIADAATAHRKRPWQLDSIESDGTSDLMTAGRIKNVYPGQSLTIVGRGMPKEKIVMNFSRGDETKTVRLSVEQEIETEIAERIYGQVSVGQLENLGRFTEEVSIAYARHFRVPGQTCSLLMLESEADYERFNIKPEDDRFVVNSSKASSLIEKKLASIRDQLADPKAELLAWLERLEKAESLQFKLPTALRIALDEVPTAAFEVGAFLPEATMRTRSEKDAINIVKLVKSYDAIQKLAADRRNEFGSIDALRTLSNLVEQNPGNHVLLRDIAFTAIEWEHPEAAFHLLRRVALARPYEGHVYTALGRCLADLEYTELAMVFYEVAINGQFPRGGNDFRKIATVEYVSMLKDIAEGRQMTSIPDYARSRYESLKEGVGFETADLVVSMMWNTDRNDVDLHVLEPSGEECFYSHPKTKMGGRITQDITTGFGPEMYVVQNAKPGTFSIKTKYFGGDALRSGVRAKVLLTIYENFGTARQTKRRETIVLEKTGDVVEVAKVKVSRGP